MRRVLIAGVLTAAATLGSATPSAADVVSTTEYRAHSVDGSTPRSLVNYMLSYPVDGDRTGVLANIRTDQSLALTPVARPGGCGVGALRVTLRFVITLPAARNPAVMDGATRASWTSFTNFARRHEEGHKRIYLACARRFETAARRIVAPTCDQVTTAATALLASHTAACGRLHQAYDLAESRRLVTLPLFRSAWATRSTRLRPPS